jgi:hypothetical protein
VLDLHQRALATAQVQAPAAAEELSFFFVFIIN